MTRVGGLKWMSAAGIRKLQWNLHTLMWEDPPSQPDNREGTFSPPLRLPPRLPPRLPSLPTFALSLYFHFTGTMEEVAKQRAEERTGGLLEQRWGGPEVLRGEDE